MSIRNIRIRWALTLLLTVAAVPLLVSAQSIVCVDTSLATFDPQIEFWKVDLSNCTDSLLEEEGGYQSAFDITIRSDGLLYGYGVTNFPGDSVMFEDGFVSGSGFFPGYLIFDPQIEGLTCDENGFAYAAGKGITKVSTEWPDSQESYLGDLPPGMQCQGDITYRKGKFYVVAIGNKLVEVDMKNPANSQVVMEFPPGTLRIHGLTTVQLDCDSVATYAVGRATNHSEVYFIDFESWTSTLVCDLPGRAFTGAASFTECMLPPCDLFIDLDNDNSSLAFWGNYCADTFCLPPMAVTDTDVVVLSMANTLDSMLLELTGIQNGATEYLETNLLNGNLMVLGSGSSSLLFINNGAASLTDFENALKSVIYQNTAVPLSYGMRQVRVTGWSGGVASIVSTADLPLSNNILQTSAVTISPTCYGLQDGSLEVETSGGTAPYSYQWLAGATDTLLTGIGAGIYPFTVMDAAGCAKTDTFSLAQPDTLVAAIANAGLPAVCINSGALSGNAVGGTLPYAFNWDNGITGANNNNLGLGDYLLTVLDSNGCEATASFTIQAGDTILVHEIASICEGESLVWNNLDLSMDTTACLVFPLPNGCDSTVCLSLTVNPSPVPQLTSSGSLCNGHSVNLTIGQFDNYLWSTGETGPEISVTGAGDYAVTVTNGFGCTATASMAISAGIEFAYSVIQPTCYGLNDGGIVIESVSSGTPPFQYSGDSVNFFQTGEFLNLPGGQYWPTVLDATGCKVIESVVLDTPIEITLNAGADETTQIGTPVNLMANTNILNPSILWQPTDFLDCATCISVTASPPYSITYTVTALDANGCEAMDSVSVLVSDDRKFYIPNAFSPNDDGINDVFTVFSVASVAQVASLEVFDRWGEKVFSAKAIPTNDLTKGWDGLFKDKAMPPGTYAFSIQLLWTDGKVEQVTGEVNLIR